MPVVTLERPDTEAAGQRAGFRVPADSGALARLAVVTGELAAAASMDSIVTVVASHVREAVGAAVSTLILRDGDRLSIAGQRGVAAEKAARWAAFSIDDENPASEAVRTGQPIVIATAAEVRRRYAGMAPDTPADRSVVSLPLTAASEVIGVIGLTFEDNWDPGPIELDFLMTFADACASAVRRVQATEEAARSAARLQFLARASAELGSSLDYRVTLTNVAHLSVPELAEWCAVDLLVDERLTTLAVAHTDPSKVAWAQALREDYPIDMTSMSGAPKVLRSGVGELTRGITDDMLSAGARDEEHLLRLRDLNLGSVMIVPLRARGSAFGTITMLRSRRTPDFTPADLTVANDLGRRAGQAIDNARLFDYTANVAAELQRAVIPDHLDSLPGWQTAGYYRAVGAVDVGGDFYDAVALPDSRLVMFVGDVMGHGIEAAAAMTQMRASIRALITVDPTPAEVLGRLDTMFDQLAIAPLVSLVYAVVDPSGHVQVANAGQAPALLVRADGGSDFLSGARRPPLGAGSGTTPTIDIRMHPGDVLLAYTDGLIERREEDLDIGLSRLAAHAHHLASDPLDTALERLATRVVGRADPEDDIAALAVRRM
jgi:GAF domain-containing protein